jgi:hypothetical protein
VYHLNFRAPNCYTHRISPSSFRNQLIWLLYAFFLLTCPFTTLEKYAEPPFIVPSRRSSPYRGAPKISIFNVHIGGIRWPIHHRNVEWEFCGDLIQRLHDEYGPLSVGGMQNLLLTRGWWPCMNQDVKAFASACPNCPVAQPGRRGQEREFPRLPTPRDIQPFQRWGIDLLGRLPKTKDGNRWILTAIDYATGWPITKALPYAAEDAIAEFIFKEIYLQFGAPQKIFTDGGKNLWGGVVQKYLQRVKTVHKGTSPYHPRTNGKVESLNGLLGRMLTKYLLGKPTRLWDLYLDQSIFTCRIRTHATTKTSPY